MDIALRMIPVQQLRQPLQVEIINIYKCHKTVSLKPSESERL